MCKLGMRTGLAALVFAFSVSPLSASLLGVLPGLPTLTYDSNGVTVFTANSNSFVLTASPLVIIFPAPYPPIPRLVMPTGSPASEVVSIGATISNTGTVLGGILGDDLIIRGQVDADGNGSIDFSGTLLTGEILQFGYEDSGGATDRFDFRFAFSGGVLAPFFVGQDIGVTETSEHSTFVDDFNVDFAGGAKGAVGPIPTIPEPSTIAMTILMGGSLFCRRIRGR